MISYTISYKYLWIPTLTACAALALQRPIFCRHSAERSDASEGGNDPDREMDPDEARDYADQSPLPDRDMEKTMRY